MKSYLIYQEVYATTQSKIQEISYSIGKALRIDGNIESYSNIINKSIENKGIEMILTDVIIDEGELILATIVDTGEALSMTDFDYKIFINGKRIANSGSSTITSPIDDPEAILSSIYHIYIKDIDLTENMDVRIIFDNLNYYIGSTQKIIKGKWQFEFNANGRELMANTHRIPLDYTFDGEGRPYVEEWKQIGEKFTILLNK